MFEANSHTHKRHISLVILNWNGCNDTIECIESLEKTEPPDFEILVIDNGSTDGSAAILAQMYPGLKLIQTGTNLGFAAGANLGIKHALDSGADYIILLNNDTVVDPAFVSELVKAAETETAAGILCSKVYFYDRPDVIWYAGAFFNPWLGWGRHKGYNMTDKGQFDFLAETERPCGCSLMVTRDFCDKVGLLDEDYFCYCEDMDWGMRAKKAGFKVVFVPNSKVWHKSSMSTGGSVTATSLYYNVRNTFRCVDKNMPLPFLLKQARYLSIIAASFISLFTMGVPKLLGIKRIVQGTSDFFFNRFGASKFHGS